MEEIWATIEEFPDYQISNFGRVLKPASRRIMRQSYTQNGSPKVNLTMNDFQFTRSVRLLVAEAFVDGRDETFNTPINLDGNQRNNRYDNLMWRPRWFAWKYAKQFKGVGYVIPKGMIKDITRDEIHKSYYAAAMANGLLVEDVARGVLMGEKVWPTGQIFIYIK